MLAHELGHIYQHDTSLWRIVGAARYCVIFLICVRVFEIAILILAIMFFASPTAPFGDWPLAILVFGAYIAIQIGACSFITYSKRRSELSADVIAADAATPSAVIDALNKHLPNAESTPTLFRSHPTRSERIRNIELHAATTHNTSVFDERRNVETNYLFWAIRQLYLIYFRPSQFKSEVEGTDGGHPKLTQGQRYVYVLKMVPWILIFAHVNNLIIGALWTGFGARYEWDISWIAVEIGVIGGVSTGLWFAGESDVVVSVVSGITYGSIAGSLFSLMDVFSGHFDFLAACFGVLIGSAITIAADYAEDEEAEVGLGFSVLMGIGMGLVLGFWVAIPSGILSLLGWLFGAVKFTDVLWAYVQSFVACASATSVVYYFLHFRVVAYPIELVFAFVALVRANWFSSSTVEAWALHPISWNEVSRLPLPFGRTLLKRITAEDRLEGLRHVQRILSERKFHKGLAFRVLENVLIPDLNAVSVKEIADCSSKLSPITSLVSALPEDLRSAISGFGEASRQAEEYLVSADDKERLASIEGALETLRGVEKRLYKSGNRIAKKLPEIAILWGACLRIERNGIDAGIVG
jgi:hypothetical protein